MLANQTPLFYAAKEGHLEMCKILIDNGCDMTHQDNSQKTASHFAKKNGKMEVYEYLNSEYQKLKEQKKVVIQEGVIESNQEEKSVVGRQKTKKKDALVSSS